MPDTERGFGNRPAHPNTLILDLANSQIGGCTFAENPDVIAPDARIIWRAERDPETLNATVRPTIASDRDGISAVMLHPWFSSIIDKSGEHVVLSDGLRRIRIDVQNGNLSHGPVVLMYLIEGSRSASCKVMPLKRAIEVTVRRRFPANLFPPQPRAQRALALLRVHDAVADGATHREIAEALFGQDQAKLAWNGVSDSMRSQVRRMVSAAKVLSAGAYQRMLNP